MPLVEIEMTEPGTSSSDSGLIRRLDSLLVRHFHQLRLPVLYLSHLLAVVLAYWLTFQLRFGFHISPAMQQLFFNTVLLLVVVRFAAWIYVRIFSGLTRYFSYHDVRKVLQSNLLGSLLFLGIIFALKAGGHAMFSVPRGIIVLEFLLTSMLIISLRFVIGLARERIILWRERNNDDLKNILVVGAGDDGVRLLREMQRDPRLAMRPIGFLDDDAVKRRATILGVPCLGGTADLERVLRDKQVDLVYFTLPVSHQELIDRLKDVCDACGVASRQVPSHHELLSHLPLLSQSQDLAERQMIGRKLVMEEACSAQRRIDYQGCTVLVTGAAGSIGSELCRQLVGRGPARLVMLDQNESGLYMLEKELEHDRGATELHTVICDVTNRGKVDKVFDKWRPDYVYHAAAYKHVPLMEQEPDEAVAVNVLGTYHLACAARDHGSLRFVLISTDKAVNPIGVMGQSKYTAEKVIASLNGGRCSYIGVRFGNVLNSNGSVVPLFRRQIEAGGPVTVTHPEVTRFFMTIGEAVYLVLAAAEISQPGELMLLDMGEPVKILDLAKRLIRAQGLVPGKDIPILITGLRPAEKLHEELYWEGEGIRNTTHPKIRAVDIFGLEEGELEKWLDRFRQVVESQDPQGAKKLLQEFVRFNLDNGHHV